MKVYNWLSSVSCACSHKLINVIRLYVHTYICIAYAGGPQITNTTAEVNTSTGEITVLQCTALGSPPPIVYWQKDGENLTNSGDARFSITEKTWGIFSSSTLNISDTVLTDFGIYTCVATNQVGEDQQNISVTVFGKDYVKLLWNYIIICTVHIYVAYFLTQVPQQYM